MGQMKHVELPSTHCRWLCWQMTILVVEGLGRQWQVLWWRWKRLLNLGSGGSLFAVVFAVVAAAAEIGCLTFS